MTGDEWDSSSAVALAAALEHGTVEHLDPDALAPPWGTLAKLAKQTPSEVYGGNMPGFVGLLTPGWCAGARIASKEFVADRLWEAQAAINGAPAAAYMDRARVAGEQQKWATAADRVLTPAAADGVPLVAGFPLTAPVIAPGWSPRSLLAGIDLDAPPPVPGLAGLAYAGKLHLLSGRPEAAKTWFALVLGVEATRQGGALLVIDTDGTGQRDVAERLISLGIDRAALSDVVYSDDPRELFNPTATPAVEAWISERATRGPVIAIIDSANPTLAALGMRLDEEGVTQLEAAMLKPIKRAGGTIILVDHVAIHADRDSPYSIGTQRKHAAADVHFRLDSVGEPLTRGGNPAPFAIRGMKDRPGGLTRHGSDRHVGRITFTPGNDGAVAHSIALGPPSAHDTRATFRPTVLMERVSRWAELQPGAFSKRDAEKEVSGKGPVIRAAVDALYGEGYLHAAGQRWTHNRPYREADDPEAAE